MKRSELKRSEFRRPRGMVELVCPCGRKVSRPAASIRKGAIVYCSRSCAADGRLRDGSETGRGPGWVALAERIRERDDRLCVRCGAAETPGRRHAVDHIVPWVLVKEIPDLANDPTNLATLCHPCHGVKTMVIEPRILRGDFLALQEFYDADTAEAGRRLLQAVPDA